MAAARRGHPEDPLVSARSAKSAPGNSHQDLRSFSNFNQSLVKCVSKHTFLRFCCLGEGFCRWCFLEFLFILKPPTIFLSLGNSKCNANEQNKPIHFREAITPKSDSNSYF